MNDFLRDENRQMLMEITMESGLVQNFHEWSDKWKEFSERERSSQKACIVLNKDFLEFLSFRSSPPSSLQKPILKRYSAYTAESIQKERLSEWDQNLAEKQNDFSRYFQKEPIPEASIFQEKEDNDIPNLTKEKMEDLIAQTIAERNYEIQRVFPPLSTKETVDKATTAYPSIKFIKIGEELSEKLESIELITNTTVSKTRVKETESKTVESLQNAMETLQNSMEFIEKEMRELKSELIFLKEKFAYIQ